MKIPENMKMKCIDYGQNFLTGQATSLIAASGVEIEATNLKDLADAIQDKTMEAVSYFQTTALKEVGYIGSQIGNAAGSVIGAGLSVMQTASQMSSLVNLAAGELTSYMASQVGSLMTYAISKATSFTGEVTKKATKKATEDSKEKLAEALKHVMGVPVENENKKKSEKKKDNKIKKAIKWCKNAAKDASDFKDKMMSYMMEDAEDISNLMLQGPAWVTYQLDSAVASGQNYAYTYFNKVKESIGKQYDDVVNASYTALAKTIVDELVTPTIQKAQDFYNDNTKNENKVVQKGMTAAQKQLLKLAGKLGVSPNT